MITFVALISFCLELRYRASRSSSLYILCLNMCQHLDPYPSLFRACVTSCILSPQGPGLSDSEDNVNKLTHIGPTYAHKLLRKIKVAICNHQVNGPFSHLEILYRKTTPNILDETMCHLTTQNSNSNFTSSSLQHVFLYKMHQSFWEPVQPLSTGPSWSKPHWVSNYPFTVFLGKMA